MARRSVQLAAQISADSQSSASDVESDETQRVLALSALLQTPKTNRKELQDFKAKVTTDRQELRAFLEQRMRQAEDSSMRRRNELTKSILEALQTPNRPISGTTPTIGNTKIARNAVFKSAANVLTVSGHLIDEYDRLENLIAGMRDAEPEGIAEAWAEDVEGTARLLRIGAESGIRNVKKVLGADVEDADTGGTKEEGKRMDGVDNMELNFELRKNLQYAEKGVKKMVRGLPSDEDR